MGLNPGGLDYNNPDTGLKAIRKRGAGTVRVTFYWREIQPSSPSSFDWTNAGQVQSPPPPGRGWSCCR